MMLQSSLRSLKKDLTIYWVVPDMLNYERTTRVGLITGLCGERSRSVKAFKPGVEEDLCHATD